MQLSETTVLQISHPLLSVPDAEYFQLPEKVLQFGTGVLLRGLPDYFIDKANKQGLFNGRIVVVKSTGNGTADAFSDQNGLYTLCIKGFEAGNTINEYQLNASISRVLSAAQEWNEVLQCATNPEMELVISNTTEVGITFVEESIHDTPPVSFPGKLLAFLYKRYQHFNGSADKGMVIVPTELIPDNGKKLKKILNDLALHNQLPEDFITWLNQHNECCNSLVDRIVPGKLSPLQQQDIEKKLGYRDELMIMAEVYRLWAIESGSEKVSKVLSFAQADQGVVVAPDINKFRELKLRLLNGSHTFTCGLAFLNGFRTVKDAMDNPEFSAFISQLMKTEIIPAIISDEISHEEAVKFADNVLDRYKNPFIDHQWLSITMEYSSKMKMRNLPVIMQYYDKLHSAPPLMSIGIAAHILFMKGKKSHTTGKYEGLFMGRSYPINDTNATVYATAWEKENVDDIVESLLSNTELWGIDLTLMPGLKDAVTEQLSILQTAGVQSTLQTVTL